MSPAAKKAEKFPSIVGDFGGTNARLAMSNPQGIFNVQEYRCANFASPGDVVRTYLEDQGHTKAKRAVIAVAGSAIDPTNVMFTQGPWGQKQLNFTDMPADDVHTINDFEAVCYSIATMSEADCTALYKTGTPFFPASILANKQAKASPTRILTSSPEHRFVCVGPGTGLGVGMGMVTDSNQFLVLTSEGGHSAFAPSDEEEMAVLRYLERECGKIVTMETFASGTGLATAFNAICKIRKIDCQIKDGSEVPIKLIDPTSHDVREAANWTLRLFARTLGSCVSAATLMSNARTVFIGGGVPKKLGAYFDQLAFTRAFLTNDLKGNNTLVSTPVMILDHAQPGLAGADFYLKLTA
ncbi:MAG: hypothetical protein A3B66_08310 [Alphaproteobacteria bacterium RIFCSPHIGHO2_02_FULL_46_13]|nr:MAG: hypothetical protein A3B66_08310 [Alphaproteobacteria bacterium RIFCSPHIGHO2_02_FULL_46_13]